MALKTSVIQATTGLASGNVDFTAAGFGVPVAAIVLVGEVSGAAGNIAISYGFTDGTNTRCSAMSHGEAAGIRGIRYHSRTEIYHYAGSSESATFVSFIADGIRLNFPNAPSSDKPITVVLLSGADVAVGDRLLTSGVESVTGIGFKPNLLFTSTVGLGATLDSNQSSAILGLGIVHNSSSDVVTQYTQVFQSATTPQISSVLGAWASAQLFNTVSWSTVAQNFGADGWDFSTTGTSNDLVHYLAIETQGRGVTIEQVNSPTTVSSLANTSQGFTPDFLMMLASTSTTVGAVKNGDFGSVFSVSFDGNATSVSADESTAPELSETFQSSRAVDMRLTNGAGAFNPQVQAALTSYDALGYTLNYTTVTGNIRRFATLTLEAPPSGIDVPVGLITITGIAPAVGQPTVIVAPTGSVSVAGQVPTLTLPITVTVDSGSVGIGGLVPLVTLPLNIIPPMGLININGLAPSLDLSVNIIPPTGSINIGGAVPLVGLPLSIVPATGQVTLAGLAPSLGFDITVTVPTGLVAVDGLAPLISLPLSIIPSTGSVGITGLTPSVVSGLVIVPPSGIINITGIAPLVGLPLNIIPPVGSVSILGLAPTLPVDVTVVVPSGSVGILGLSPTLTLTVQIITPLGRQVILLATDRTIIIPLPDGSIFIT